MWDRLGGGEHNIPFPALGFFKSFMADRRSPLPAVLYPLVNGLRVDIGVMDHADFPLIANVFIISCPMADKQEIKNGRYRGKDIHYLLKTIAPLIQKKNYLFGVLKKT